jgi:hypothetical protein
VLIVSLLNVNKIESSHFFIRKNHFHKLGLVSQKSALRSYNLYCIDFVHMEKTDLKNCPMSVGQLK